MAVKNDITSPGRYRHLELTSTILDRDGSVVDESTIVYDCAAFSDAVCGKNRTLIVILGLVALAVITVAFFEYRKRGGKSAIPLAIAGLFVLSFALLYEASSFNVNQSSGLVKMNGTGGGYTQFEVKPSYELTVLQITREDEWPIAPYMRSSLA